MNLDLVLFLAYFIFFSIITMIVSIIKMKKSQDESEMVLLWLLFLISLTPIPGTVAPLILLYYVAGFCFIGIPNLLYNLKIKNQK